jgi:hypothetical protein
MSDVADESKPASLRAAWIEIGVVVAVAVLPHLANAVLAFASDASDTWPGPISSWVSHAMTSASIAAAVLFVMARSGKPWAHFGVTRLRPVIDLPVALALFLITLILTHLTWGLLHPFVTIADYVDPVTPASEIPNPVVYFVVFVVAMTANAWAEELAIRGFLIPRLLDVGWNRVAAVTVPTLLFASYHVYQGVAPAILIAVSALAGSALFLAVRRLWPFVLAHLALNLFNAF